MRTLRTIVMTALISGLSVGAVATSGATGEAVERRGYVAGKYGLELSSANVGWVFEAGGGGPVADVTVQQKAEGQYPKKHVAAVKYQDITLAVGAGMQPAFYDWIKATLRSPGGAARKDGAVVVADYRSRETSRTTFTRAVVSDVEFPALDVASKDAVAKINVTISPQATRRVVSSAQGLVGAPVDKSMQRKWAPSSFRLSIDGIDPSATASVVKVDAISARTRTVGATGGDLRDYEKTPSGVDVSNLAIELPEAHAEPFYRWLDDFLARGNNADDKEKSGKLELLAQDLKGVVFTLSFGHLGIIKVVPVSAPEGDANRRVRVEMYVESLGFDFVPSQL